MAAAAESQTTLYIQEIPKECLKIKRRVGRGGFGEVYLAYDAQRHHDCAVKCLIGPSEFTVDEKKNLKAEADKMTRVRDDNVISFYGLCINAEKGICGLVMPFMSNGSLSQLLRHTSIELPWPLRIRILYQIARGMNALHLLNPKIIHMDLKSGNILLTDNFEVKVADFGLSRLKKHASRNLTKTKLAGTLTHIPPEYLDNVNLAPNTKFDVYSFGVTVWEVLTRELPYRNALNENMIKVGVVGGQRPDLSLVPTNVEPQYEVHTIKHWMHKCWGQDPVTRPEFTDVVGGLKKLAERFAADAQECSWSVQNCMKEANRQVANSSKDGKDTKTRTLSEVLQETRAEYLQEEEEGQGIEVVNNAVSNKDINAVQSTPANEILCNGSAGMLGKTSPFGVTSNVTPNQEHYPGMMSAGSQASAFHGSAPSVNSQVRQPNHQQMTSGVPQGPPVQTSGGFQGSFVAASTTPHVMIPTQATRATNSMSHAVPQVVPGGVPFVSQQSSLLYNVSNVAPSPTVYSSASAPVSSTQAMMPGYVTPPAMHTVPPGWGYVFNSGYGWTLVPVAGNMSPTMGMPGQIPAFPPGTAGQSIPGQTPTVPPGTAGPSIPGQTQTVPPGTAGPSIPGQIPTVPPGTAGPSIPGQTPAVPAGPFPQQVSNVDPVPKSPSATAAPTQPPSTQPSQAALEHQKYHVTSNFVSGATPEDVTGTVPSSPMHSIQRGEAANYTVRSSELSKVAGEGAEAASASATSPSPRQSRSARVAPSSGDQIAVRKDRGSAVKPGRRGRESTVYVQPDVDVGKVFEDLHIGGIAGQTQFGFPQLNINNCGSIHIGHRVVYKQGSDRDRNPRISNPNGPLSMELKEELASQIHKRQGDGQKVFSALGLTQGEMKRIFENNRDSDLEQLMMFMFEAWEEKKGGDATREKFKRVCVRLRRQDLVECIAEDQE